MPAPRLAQYPPSSTESQWFFTRKELDNPPSLRDNVPLKEERRSRQRMIQALWQFRHISKQPQLVINTAATMLQRFYMRESYAKWDKYTAVAAAFFLASKVEEKPLNSKNVTSMLLWLRKNGFRPNLDPDAWRKGFSESEYANPTFMKQRKDILHYEETMLRMECFDMNLRHPHALLGKAVKRIWSKGKGKEEVDRSSKTLDCSWSVANDTLAAPTCLLFPPQMIAAACLTIALSMLRLPLPRKPLSISEQRTLWELDKEEGEEEDGEPFEEDVYWLDLFETRSDQLREPILYILDNWQLSQDEFVRDESSRLRPKILKILDELPRWPKEEVKEEETKGGSHEVKDEVKREPGDGAQEGFRSAVRGEVKDEDVEMEEVKLE